MRRASTIPWSRTTVLHRAGDAQGSALLVQVADFRSPVAAHAMRRAAAERLPRSDGLVFAKTMSCFGSRRGHGFTGVPDPRRQLVLTAWRTPTHAIEHASGATSDELMAGAASHWHVVGEVLRARGAHAGARPLAPAEPPADHAGPIAVLTLGRATPRTFGRFAVHGGRLSPVTRRPHGLVTAQSAGWPLTGNMTFSIWESERDMLGFAYGREAGGHGAVARARPPILRDQLNARLRPWRIGGRWDPRTTQHAERLERLERLARALDDEWSDGRRR